MLSVVYATGVGLYLKVAVFGGQAGLGYLIDQPFVPAPVGDDLCEW